ncbi:uncharacterized protein G2W53_021800 [Senna tora]|uniref:Uncharacterized protein n=1 Tax=Senna tora TaxID=362788 RepID=A0A834W0Z0_9FABA|nr:uncharacterized protein G2W53_044016 [Senna tora]KAF7823656.1 uncharacterized protein G2W53_021800 [Senna tora]
MAVAGVIEVKRRNKEGKTHSNP